VKGNAFPERCAALQAGTPFLSVDNRRYFGQERITLEDWISFEEKRKISFLLLETKQTLKNWRLLLQKGNT
jgi:hypothetical protein